MNTPTSEENRKENVKYWSVGLDIMDTPESFIEELDPGLLTYKDELFTRSVTSLATLKLLRPREVCDMKIPQVYKRLLIDKLISLQSSDTKKEMKRDRSPFCKSSDDLKSATPAVFHKPKQLKFVATVALHLFLDPLRASSSQLDHRICVINCIEKVGQVRLRLGYCFTPYQRLWLYNGAPLVAFYDTLGIRRTYSRLAPPASSRGRKSDREQST